MFATFSGATTPSKSRAGGLTDACNSTILVPLLWIRVNPGVGSGQACGARTLRL